MFRLTSLAPASAIRALALFGTTVWLSLAFPFASQAQYTKPPFRGANSTSCPPILNFGPPPPGYRIAKPDKDRGDKDVNGDGIMDWFMGEWKFIDGIKDLIVTKWCIGGNKEFSFQINTSKGGTQTVAVPPGPPV
jgi:hypothetical protein